MPVVGFRKLLCRVLPVSAIISYGLRIIYDDLNTRTFRLFDVEPDGNADDATMVSTPEPGSLGLLFTGLLCIGALTGALANRRNHSVASA
jgi:hypothetical protein